jgi:hypothetical protein
LLSRSKSAQNKLEAQAAKMIKNNGNSKPTLFARGSGGTAFNLTAQLGIFCVLVQSMIALISAARYHC